MKLRNLRKLWIDTRIDIYEICSCWKWTIFRKSKFKEYAKDCKVIACDGGIDHCRKDNIVPDIMVGDFDSATNENYMYFKNMGVEEISFQLTKI